MVKAFGFFALVLATSSSLFAQEQENSSKRSTEDQQDEKAAADLVDEIIEAHIEALGGHMSLEVVSVVASGELTTNQAGRRTSSMGEATMYYKEGTFVFGLNKDDDGKHRSLWGYHNDEHWRKDTGTGEVSLVGVDGIGWVKCIAFNSQQALHWRDWGVEITRIEDSTFDDLEVRQLKFDFAETRKVTHCFSKEGGLLIGSKVTLSSNFYNVSYEYTEVEGCQCVKSVVVRHAHNEAALVHTYSMTSFDFESTIPDEVLERPNETVDGEEDKEGAKNKAPSQ